MNNAQANQNIKVQLSQSVKLVILETAGSNFIYFLVPASPLHGKGFSFTKAIQLFSNYYLPNSYKYANTAKF